jgi:hypothetical protein
MVMSPVGLGTKNHCAGEDQQQRSTQQSVFERLSLPFGIEISETMQDVRTFIK